MIISFRKQRCRCNETKGIYNQIDPSLIVKGSSIEIRIFYFCWCGPIGPDAIPFAFPLNNRILVSQFPLKLGQISGFLSFKVRFPDGVHSKDICSHFPLPYTEPAVWVSTSSVLVLVIHFSMSMSSHQTKKSTFYLCNRSRLMLSIFWIVLRRWNPDLSEPFAFIHALLILFSFHIWKYSHSWFEAQKKLLCKVICYLVALDSVVLRKWEQLNNQLFGEAVQRVVAFCGQI